MWPSRVVIWAGCLVGENWCATYPAALASSGVQIHRPPGRCVRVVLRFSCIISCIFAFVFCAPPPKKRRNSDTCFFFVYFLNYSLLTAYLLTHLLTYLLLTYLSTITNGCILGGRRKRRYPIDQSDTYVDHPIDCSSYFTLVSHSADAVHATSRALA